MSNGMNPWHGLGLVLIVFLTGCTGGTSAPAGTPAPATNPAPPGNPATTYNLSGRVSLTQGGNALAGVMLTLGGGAAASQPTDASGNYVFAGLNSGDYTISPSKTGYTFTPASRTVTISSTDMTGNDFTASPTPPPAPNTRNYTLYIVAGTLTVHGKNGASTSLPAWGYTDVANSVPKFPAPALFANPDDVVTVTVANNHNIDHNFLIKGITDDMTPIAPGQSRTYKFTALKDSAGSHIYYDTLNKTVNREMGLYGAMIIKPVDGATKTVWTGGPAYTLDYTWVIGEMDKTHWNDVAASGAMPVTAAYDPDYYLINGKGGLDAEQDANTAITGKVGNTVLVRIVNGGQFPYSMHFHANHVKVAAVDGLALTAPFKQLDVVSVPALGTVDLLYDLNQSGEYLMHVHTTQAEASGGVYLNGIMAMIHIQ